MGDSSQPCSLAASVAARVAMFGYGPEARAQAQRLRQSGANVTVVVRSGGMSWVRAVSDGFRPELASAALASADTVVVHVPESEQPALWAHTIAPRIARSALAVFARGSALYVGALEPDPRLDVVLVSRPESEAQGATCTCRIAVFRDASGRALERAAAFAAAAAGEAPVRTTTVATEVRAELDALVARCGGLEALIAECDRVIECPSCEPDESTLAYYERLRAVLVDGGPPPRIPSPPVSTIMFTARKQGAA
jgi:ketol-acid reductoisomerase